MLIASHFHDYYDVGARYGVDKTVVYERNDYFESSDLALQSFAIYRRDKDGRYVRGSADPINVTPFLIGFCGKVYPTIYTYPVFNAPPHFFYTPESFLEYLASIKYFQPESRYKHSDPMMGGEKWARNYFTVSRESEKYQKIFLEHKAPIYVLGERPICEGERESQDVRFRRNENLLINPRLKDYEFVKVKHPIEAFQEIYMFISGLLGTPERETVQISDKDLQAAKGFTHKYSFRKEPAR